MTRPATGPAAGRPAVVGWVGLVVGGTVLAGALGGSLAGPDPGVRVGAALTRAGADAAAVACVGLTLLGVLLPLGAAALPGAALRDLVRVQAAADRALVAVAGAWLALLLAGTAFRTADALGRSVGQLSVDDVGAWTTRLAAGRGTLLTAGCAATALGCGIARLRRRDAVQVRIPLVAALLGALMPALTGHTGSAPDHQVAVVAAALHVGATALWVGGLGAVLVLVTQTG